MTLINHSKIGRKNVILLKCDNCGVDFYAKKGTRDLTRKLHFCRATCAQQSLSDGKLKEKIQNSNLEKYGFIVPSLSDEVRIKIEKTNLERYGFINPLMNASIQNKAQQTNLEKYGSICSLTNNEVKQKREQTWENKYGGHPLSNEGVQTKIKETNLERYGSEIFTDSVYYKKVVRENNLEKYGVESVLSLPQVREKIKHTNVERYGQESYAGSPDHQSKIDHKEIAQKAWQTKIKNGSCSKSEPEEKLNAILVDEFGRENIQRQVSVLKQWIDFYIVSLDLYIQVDGVYWHGLNRDPEIIKLGLTSQDKKICKQILRDEKLNQYAQSNNMNLVRLTDEQIINYPRQDILKILKRSNNYAAV